MEKILLAIIFILLLIVIISIIYSHFKLDITTYDIKSNKIDKDISLMFLSDYHNRKIYDKLFELIKNNPTDIIIFGGDMINESLKKTSNFMKLIKLLDKYNIYYTFGNHESELCNDIDKYTDIINKTNIKLLNNNNEMLSKNICLYGLFNGIETYLNLGKKGLNKEYIESKIGELDKDKFNILIAHNPLEFDSYVKYEPDLVLSGHVHGGLARIPIIDKGVLSPDVTFFPKYDKGLYEKKNTKMIVSRGIGYSERIPFRIFNPGEIVIINLKNK